MNLLNFFKSAPHIEEVQDKIRVEKDYFYWRIRILYSTFIGYALYYFTRLSFTFARPAIMTDLGYSKSQLGMLTTILSLSYGLSKFGSGILADRSNARYFMAFGLILTGLWNICFGFSSSLLFLAIFWGLNGWFQGFGWPPVARFLTQWYSHSERGSWWAIWNVSHNVGAFLIPLLVGIIIQFWGWRWAMFIPGIVCIIGGLFLVERLRDTPQSLGLPPIEKFRGDYTGVADVKELSGKEATGKELLLKYVLKNPYIWLLAVAYFFVYVVRVAVNEWSALSLLENKNYGLMGANGCVSLFEVGGFFGSLIAGWSSDRIFKGKRGPVNVLYAIGMPISITLMWLIPPGYGFLDGLALFLVGFTVFGPQMMIGVAAAEVSHKKAAATSTGFIGCFAYVGAAVAGYPFGKLIQDWGWQGCYIGMLVCCFISIAALLPTWNLMGNFHQIRAKQEEKSREKVEYA